MSTLLPVTPTPADSSATTREVNGQYVVADNGARTLRDGGPRAQAPEVVDVSVTLVVIEGERLEIGEADLPGGIDYARWSGLALPASREGFADPLDFVDLFDD